MGHNSCASESSRKTQTTKYLWHAIDEIDGGREGGLASTGQGTDPWTNALIEIVYLQLRSGAGRGTVRLLSAGGNCFLFFCFSFFFVAFVLYFFHIICDVGSAEIMMTSCQPASSQPARQRGSEAAKQPGCRELALCLT